MRDQAREFANDAQALRDLMEQAGLAGEDIQSVDDVLEALGRLQSERPYQDPQDVQDLQLQALQSLQQLELNLRKQMDTTNDQLFLSGSEEVPPGFRSLIERYYRELSRRTSGGGR